LSDDFRHRIPRPPAEGRFVTSLSRFVPQLFHSNGAGVKWPFPWVSEFSWMPCLRDWRDCCLLSVPLASNAECTSHVSPNIKWSEFQGRLSRGCRAAASSPVFCRRFAEWKGAAPASRQAGLSLETIFQEICTGGSRPVILFEATVPLPQLKSRWTSKNFGSVVGSDGP
jgi:hypothetical protein